MTDYLITESDFLYRRFSILDEPNYAVFWKIENGQKIPSSAAFKTKSNENGLSVDIAELTKPEITVGNKKEFGVAEISAAIPMSLGYICKHDPMPNNNAHALIIGDTTSIAKKLSRAVTQVFQFPNE
jgi:hypothetical protein